MCVYQPQTVLKANKASGDPPVRLGRLRPWHGSHPPPPPITPHHPSTAPQHHPVITRAPIRHAHTNTHNTTVSRTLTLDIYIHHFRARSSHTHLSHTCLTHISHKHSQLPVVHLLSSLGLSVHSCSPPSSLHHMESHLRESQLTL